MLNRPSKAPPPYCERFDNTYKVVVVASDGGRTNLINWFKVTVNVTDMEEEGKVTWTVDPMVATAP